MRRFLAIIALLCATLVPAAAPGETAATLLPSLTGRVVDDAGVLDAAVRERLRATLAAHEAQTTNQVVVATVQSLGDTSVEEYANRLFRHWQLGQRGSNNGVLLLHAPKERKIRIEVGYGLEGTLTDAIAKNIIQTSIAPRFKANDFAGGMTEGVDAIIRVLGGGGAEFKRQDGLGSWAPPELMFWAIVALIVLANTMGILLPAIHAGLVALGLARKKPKSGFWHWVHNAPLLSHGGSSGSWSSSDSSWSSSSDSFSGGGGDSGGGGASGDY